MLKILIAFLTTTLNALAQPVTYQQSDSITVCRMLQEAGRDATTLTFARQFIGRPYVAHTLEVNDHERLVVNTRQLDCTTLVETVTALTICARQGKTQWYEYLETLRMLRYRYGHMDEYPSRLHYFTEWIVDNERMGFVDEIQAPKPPFTAVQKIKVDYMSEHPQAYKALKANPVFIPEIRQREEALTDMQFRYIPKSEVKNTKLLRETIHDGDIIAITCKKPGLDIAHLGFAVWRKDGLHLLNASMIHKKVVDEPMTLQRYLYKHSSHTGIRIIRLK